MSTNDAAAGRWIDVARISRPKLLLHGIWSLVIGIAMGVVYVSSFRKLRDELPGFGAICELILVPAVVLYCLRDIVNRIRMVISGECKFQIGAQGVRVRRASSEVNLPWNDVQKWYPSRRFFNGLETYREIVFLRSDNQKLEVDVFCFRESQEEIVANIRSAIRSFQ